MLFTIIIYLFLFQRYSKHISTLGRVCGLVECFSRLIDHQNIEIRLEGTGKE